MPRRTSKKATPKKPRYVIRKVDPIVHAEDITTMLREGFGEDAGGRSTAFIGMAWWVAFEVSSGVELPVGCASMCHSAIEEGTFYLARAFVASEHRGYGLQRKLIKARVARAKELKGTHASSDTYDNPQSTNNLIACGFRCYRPVSPWRSGGTSYWRVAL